MKIQPSLECGEEHGHTKHHRLKKHSPDFLQLRQHCLLKNNISTSNNSVKLITNNFDIYFCISMLHFLKTIFIAFSKLLYLQASTTVKKNMTKDIFFIN